MATTSVSRNDLVSLTSLSFIRPRNIEFSCTATKPSTRMYAFFDGVSVNQFITPTGGVMGGPIVSTSSGVLTGIFHMPGNTFNTGSRIFRLQDDPIFESGSIPGTVTGSASAFYTALGLLGTFQETINNTVTVNNTEVRERVTFVERQREIVREAPTFEFVLVDPLAQSFFTYGIPGGLFITKIDLFFDSKDANIPVTLQIREMVNGYPGLALVSPWATMDKNPVDVALSKNASAKTEFAFSRPIYLEENKEYCFVLLANSNAYHVWTSRLSEISVETGLMIFDQPFIGSLFKSENNITWTAEQNEDVKFTIHKADFDTTSRDVIFSGSATPMLLMGSDLNVVSGSSVVIGKFNFQHGHKTGEVVSFRGIPNGVYRGITSAAISNVNGFSVNVIDEYTMSFNCGFAATSTGTLAASGILNAVIVDITGTGYVSPTLAFSGGGGSGAAAFVNVMGGRIISATITSVGSGYTSTPSLTISDPSGTGALVVPISEAIFQTSMNRKYQSVMPVISNFRPPNTRIASSMSGANYADFTKSGFEVLTLNRMRMLNRNGILPNNHVEATSFSNNPSTELIIRFESDNKNVSPMLDMGEIPRITMNNYVVNKVNAIIDLVSGTSWLNGVATFNFSGNHTMMIGSKFIVADAIPVGYNGTFIVVSVLSEFSVTAVLATNPTAWVSGGKTGDSESLPEHGNSYSRYISKANTLDTPSKGVRVIVNAASTTESSFDVYFRTSMSSGSLPHTQGTWRKMSCPVSRNRSETWVEYKDYEFSIDALEQFDVYDIKIVLNSTVQHLFPKIANYRAIILAT